MSDEPDYDRWREYRVTPRYLAGSSYAGDPGFEPVADWPHHSLDDGPCQLLVTSPDHRIKIGWFGDDFDLWKITAAEDAVSPPRWEATFNHTFPPEIVASLTSALAHDWGPDSDAFLTSPSIYWADSVQPLLDANWERLRTADPDTVELLAPDRQAGAFIDTRSYGSHDEAVLLWAGRPGGSTRAEATFTSSTPSHLIAATAAAMSDPTPLVRERHMIHRDIEHLVRLEPVEAETQSRSRAPTPLDVKQAAVTAAVHRAAHGQPSAARAHAARIRTTHPRPQPSVTRTSPHRRDAPAQTASRPRR
ncbi:DUF317 domain-containing protein [Streptomyces sp. RTd22]|uniref:DUF317 domain-containing protein n=1 Tax=Streptomyces sp. RTd22 TaxID=1841249 RepID=UPI0007C4DEBA|nr:DUF317 domain-containing protein [Streptomyces sp. RTd22]